MLKAIDKWLVNHNFNPIFNKDLVEKPKPEQRRNKVNEIEEEIELSVAFFEQAIHQVGVVTAHIDEGIKEAQQDIQIRKAENREDEKLIQKLENRKDRTQRIQENLESVIAPAMEDTEDEDDFVDPLE